MQTTIIETQEQLETLLDDSRCLIVRGSLEIKFSIGWSYGVRYIRADGYISATGDIRATGDISARGYISATGHIRADGYISATGNISATGDISAKIIYFVSIYAPKFKSLICDAFVPRAGNNDRQQWAERFGINTSAGCWEEFIQRLAEVAPRLLENESRWLPVERIMLKSVLGHYRES